MFIAFRIYFSPSWVFIGHSGRKRSWCPQAWPWVLHLTSHTKHSVRKRIENELNHENFTNFISSIIWIQIWVKFGFSKILLKNFPGDVGCIDNLPWLTWERWSCTLVLSSRRAVIVTQTLIKILLKPFPPILETKLFLSV